MTPAQRTRALLDGGFLTELMQIRAVDLGLLARDDLAPAVQTKIDNQATIKTQAAAAMTTNTTFLVIASPTAAQVAAQVKALTRQVDGIVRLLLSQLDATT